MNKLSVVICTYKHSDRFLGLKKTIESLSREKNHGSIYEVVIVDNGDSITEEEKRELLSLSSKIVFVKEEKIGLSVSRNTGVKNSKGDIVSFIDDDVWASELWANNILSVYINTEVLCSGGEVKMMNTEVLKNKKWVSSYFLRFLYPTAFPDTTGPILPPYFLIGANMSFRRGVFTEYGLFYEGLGRVGDKLLSCEDIEYISRLPRENVFFVKDAEVFGEIDHGRLTKRYMLQRLFWQGYSDYIFIKRVGVRNFFDKDEIFFNSGFIKYIFSKIVRFKFFEFICAIARIYGFYLSKKQN